ncbi:hypothetical protein EXIGLDRAFT_620584 [Exidia glandulosa HHB12029]|uniref:Carbohydrate-binding domain-containing protein n=1 Tax=Exidia glandulosa HHB12029 TaxID=1314781 RepID=A0A165EQE0_EXIGL|nr:hypothetical protein EXIGLDRAFT_620584 [Exidia glandulosa HHB12029]
MLAAFLLALLSSPLVHVHARAAPAVPSLDVPACPSVGTATFSKSIPDLAPFPTTSVSLCYTSSTLSLIFTALNESSFFYNENYTTNGDLWQYEVMEAFIYKGTNDPTSYVELEIAPNNVTYQSFIYNPGKGVDPSTPFDEALISNPIGDGLVASTTLDRDAGTWRSSFSVPLALFSVDEGWAKGTKWRMNFFRTVVSRETFPDFLGGWSPPDEPSFHITPFFGHVVFV